ncbi:MAG TPA: NUDIX hydrolase [Steroidobacteraceae bacterium]|nr:NUDIX hydrolase [Steroidobacteraceae bacterium]
MNVLDWARKVRAIAQNGLMFTHDEFDRERYEKLQALADSIVSDELGLPVEQVKSLWQYDPGYVTPKVDVRGAVFEADRILLVRERSDGKWSLPGGWVDVNDSPSEAVAREIYEESGFHARPVKLAALFDRQRHPHPPSMYHIYKLLFLCELTGGAARISNETDAVEFFGVDSLPELSPGRVTRAQIERMFEHHRQRELPTDFD